MKLFRFASAVLSLLIVQPSFAADVPKEPLVYPFIEIVYELNTEPLKDHAPAERAKPEDLNGYFLRTSPDLLRPKLFSAMGTAFTEPAKDTMFIGYRVRNLSQHEPENYQSLKSLADKGALAIDTAKEPSPLQSFHTLGVFGTLRPPVSVSIKRENESEFKIVVNGKSSSVKPGETVTVFEKEEKHTPEEWIKLYEEAAKKAGFQANIEELKVSFKILFPSGAPVTLYARISAINQGNVSLHGADVLREWNLAQEKLLSGPYEEARKALEEVIKAVPERGEALRLYDTLKMLEEQGKKPAQIKGKIIFPAEPDQKLKDFWKKYGAGVAAIAEEKAPENTAIATSPVKDGTFSISIPSGSYRLIVTVPGYEIYKQQIQANETTQVDIPLKEN